MKCIYRQFLCITIIAFMFLPTVIFATDQKIVRIGYYENDNFQAGASDTKMKSGYSYEYMRRLQTYTNWEYEYVYGKYGELYQKLLKGDIDILTGLAFSKDRVGKIGYPELAMGDTPYSFLKRTDDTTIIPKPDALNGKKIGTIDGVMKNIVKRSLKANNIQATVVIFNDLQARDSALLKKEVDVTIVEGNGTGAMEGVEVFAEAGTGDYFVCTNINRPDILEDLNKAQTEMFHANPKIKAELNEKWFRQTVYSTTLSQSEKDWIEDHRTFVVGYFDNYLPYASTDENGNVTGVIKDMVPEIFKSLGANGIKFSYKGYHTYKELLTAIRAKEIDVIFPNYGNFWTNEQYGLMPTNPIISTYFNVIFSGSYPDMPNPRIAVRQNNALVRKFIAVEIPEREEVFCQSVEKCMDLVLEGKADATLISGLRTDYYLRLKDRYKKLTAVQATGEVPISFAVQKSDPQTLDILNHGLSLIDPDYALSQSYQYEMKHQLTIHEFIRENLWLPILVLVLIATIIIAFITRELHKSKLYLAKERKQKEETAEGIAIIKSLSSIYFATLEINIRTGKLKVFRIPDFIKERFSVFDGTFESVKEKYILSCVNPSYQESVRKFMDVKNLVKQLKKHGYLQKNYLGNTEGWCRITMVPVKNDQTDKIEKVVFAVENINEEKKREEQIQYKAEHDELTGTLNRTAYSRLKEELKTNKHPMALMIMDVDHFKEVNDTYGHSVGDTVLKQVAGILQHSFRSLDHVIRYGGDEFVVIFSDCNSGFEHVVKEKVNNINAVLLHPTMDGIPPVSVSAGIATFNDSFGPMVFRNADIALYHTKTNGRIGCNFYNDSMEAEAKSIPDRT